jgi:hypothetical protein
MADDDVVTISFKREATAEPGLTLSIPIDDIQGKTVRNVMWLAYTKWYDDDQSGSVLPTIDLYFGEFEICAAAAAASATTTTTTAASPLNLDDLFPQILRTRSFVIRKKSAGTYCTLSCYGWPVVAERLAESLAFIAHSHMLSLSLSLTLSILFLMFFTTNRTNRTTYQTIPTVEEAGAHRVDELRRNRTRYPKG